jgi:hypothetical protein
MKYRTVPFMSRARPRVRRTVSPKIPGGAIMNGLEPIMGKGMFAFGPLGPGSGFQGLRAYGPEYPNSSFLSGPPAPTALTAAPIAPENVATIRLRADNSKAPGFPGFFQWLAESDPVAYNHISANVPPHLLSQAKVLRTSGATVSGMGLGAVYKGKFADRFYKADIAGLGDTTGNAGVIAADSAPITTNYSPALISTSFDAGSAPLQTVAIADTGESTSAPTLSSAGSAQLVSSIVQAGQAIVTGVNQQTLFNTNLARAQAGLPPLTMSGSTITGIAADPTTLLLIGGGILAVVLVMNMSKKSA